MHSFRDIVFTISSVSDVSEILPLTVWLIFGSRKTPYLQLGIFFIVCFFVKLYTLITADLHENNMPAYHLLALLEVAAVYIFYCQLLYRKVFKWGIFLLVMLHVGNALFFQKIWTFNSLTWTLDMLFIITLGLIYFYHIYKDEDDYTPLRGRPDFIITIGWLLYAAGSLFTYLMGSEILSGYAEGFFKNGWFFQTISNILKDMIISYGFWLTNKK
jgi:hypothetical protein